MTQPLPPDPIIPGRYEPTHKPMDVCPTPQKVQTVKIKVTDFDMPFMSMVSFTLKLAVASIPALLLLGFLLFLISMVLAGLFIDLLSGMGAPNIDGQY